MEKKGTPGKGKRSAKRSDSNDMDDPAIEKAVEKMKAITKREQKTSSPKGGPNSKSKPNASNNGNASTTATTTTTNHSNGEKILLRFFNCFERFFLVG